LGGDFILFGIESHIQSRSWMVSQNY